MLDREAGAGVGAGMMREMHHAVDLIGDVVRREGIDCGYAKGGAIWFASDSAQLKRLRWRFAMLDRHRLGDAYRLLGPAATTARVNATGIHGSIYTPHAAAVHPARLARGLARAVERLGGTLYEQTPALRIDERRVVTPRGIITADVVVRATEAYTGSLHGHGRTVVPIGNIVIATEHIPEALWAEIGLSNRELFEDSPNLLAYGQRTADGRIVWGGLGATYGWGSKVPPSPMQAPHMAARLRARLVERFPMLRDVAVTHHWGGAMGMTRDMRSTVGFDRTTGEAWTTGFGGAGVAPTNTAETHPRRSDHRGRDQPDTPAVGQSSLRALGTRAAPLVRRDVDPDPPADRRQAQAVEFIGTRRSTLPKRTASSGVGGSATGAVRPGAIASLAAALTTAAAREGSVSPNLLADARPPWRVACRALPDQNSWTTNRPAIAERDGQIDRSISLV